MKVSLPIIEFKNLKEANKCLKEWKSKLFLNDWFIKIEFKNLDEMNIFGEVEFVKVKKCAIIRLAPKNETNIITMTKYCAERTLIHELLHIVLDNYANIFQNHMDSILFTELQHEKIEVMTKALLMAKYNITSDWFYNFNEN